MAHKLVRRHPTVIKLPCVAGGQHDAHDDVNDDAYANIDMKLKAAKSCLDEIPSKVFNSLSWNLDMYTLLKGTLKAKYGFQISTNASLKIYEMIEELKLIRPTNGRFKAFCNAELPGAFISTIIHYMSTRRPDVGFEWVASSYFPEGNESMLGDTYGMYKGHRDNWLMGPELSGDLTDEGTIVRIAAAAGENDLYTSDAGIDVSDDYNKQEESTALLNFGQIICGLLSLREGGCMVTKQYTFNTKFNRSLILGICCAFEEFYIVKPLTSRPLNSEVYLIGKGFRKKASAGLCEHLIGQFKMRKGMPQPWPPMHYHGCDGGALLAAATEICNAQISNIHEALMLARVPHLASQMQPYKIKAQELWINKYMK